MKFYQLDNKLKRRYINIDTKKIRTLKDLIKLIYSNKDLLEYDSLNIRSCYIENIPKKICNYKDITIVIDNNSIRYFSSLCD